MSRQSTTIVNEELDGKIMVVNFFTPKKTKFLCVWSNYANKEDFVLVQNFEKEDQNRYSETLSMAFLSESYVQSDLPDQRNWSKNPQIHIHSTW
jgi:hypothetical protein